MDKAEILEKAELFVRGELQHDSSGHDWWHIWRVTRTAKMIAQHEGADVFVCELAALLHDIADDKLNSSEEAGMRKVEEWLSDHEVEKETAAHILEIISAMSFKGGGRLPMRTLEGKIVQDADRLDALGAIGIARTFAYSGARGQPIHDPLLEPREQMTTEQYRSERSTAINHFHEKLLKLKNLMNTDYGKKAAAERHRIMEQFLNQFYREWDAIDI